MPPEPEPNAISLDPSGSIDRTVGELQSLTATVTDGNGSAVEGVDVEFTDITTFELLATVTTNGSGEAEFTYTRLLPGEDIVRAEFFLAGFPVSSDDLIINWLAAPPPPPEPEPNAISLDPSGSIDRTVGELQSLTATVTDGNGSPVEGVDVEFTDIKTFELLATVTTNGSGEAEFTYTRLLPGEDIVRAEFFLAGFPVSSDDLIINWLLPPDPVAFDITMDPSGFLAATVGQDETLTATVKDESGDPVANEPVTFFINGDFENASQGPFSTNAAGEVSITLNRGTNGDDIVRAGFFDSNGFEHSTFTLVIGWVAASADPTFSLIPNGVPGDACICTPPMMNNEAGLQAFGASVQNWFVKDDGAAGLSVEFNLSTVNLTEAGYHEIEVFDSSNVTVAGPVELRYYSNISPPPAVGAPGPSTVILIPSAGSGDIYRVQLTVRGDILNPDVIFEGEFGQQVAPGIEVVARHYDLKFNGAIEAGMGSPSLRQIEAAPATWVLNVDAGETPQIIFNSVGLIAGAEKATVELRDPTGAVVDSFSVATPAGAIYEILEAGGPAASAGQWTLSVSGLDHHYILNKLSGADRGIYLTWLTFGSGTITVNLTDDIGNPFTGTVDLVVTRTGPGPGSTLSFPGVTGPTFQTPLLTPGFYSVTITPPAGFTVTPALTLNVSVSCQMTAHVIFHLTAPGGEESDTTRTQGFWSTHFQAAKDTWLAAPNDGRKVLGTKNMTNHSGVMQEVMGGFWSNISKKSTGKGKIAKRSSLDQARMALVQQYLAAVLNVSAFGSDDGGVIADGKAAYEGSDRGAMIDAAAALTAFNEGGDGEPLPAGFNQGPADSKTARNVADLGFWDVLP